MKKKTQIPLGALLLALCFLDFTLARAAQSGDFTYEVSQSTVTITKYTGNNTDIAIPASIEGMPVTRIGTNAFLSNVNAITITIPDSVTSLEYQAFANCSNMTSITIGKNVASIGSLALVNCYSLKNIFVDMLNGNYSDKCDKHRGLCFLS